MFEARGRHAIIIPVARVDNVSAATGSFLVSPPSPMAALGLMRKMELDLVAAGILEAGTPWFVSVVLAVHEFEVSAGHRRIPPERLGEHDKKAGAMIDDPEAHLLCSLVISTEIETPEKLEQVRHYLASKMLGYRLGGGRIVRAGIASSNSGPGCKPGLRVVESAWDEDAFSRIVRALPAGSVLVDRTAMLDDPGQDQKEHSSLDPLDRLLDYLAVTKHLAPGEPPEKATYTRLGQGWMVPVQIGFRALSSVQNRPGMRMGDGVQGHVWVEDVLGLGQWIKIRKCLSSASASENVAWRYAECPAQGPYLAVGTER